MESAIREYERSGNLERAYRAYARTGDMNAAKGALHTLIFNSEEQFQQSSCNEKGQKIVMTLETMLNLRAAISTEDDMFKNVAEYLVSTGHDVSVDGSNMRISNYGSQSKTLWDGSELGEKCNVEPLAMNPTKQQISGSNGRIFTLQFPKIPNCKFCNGDMDYITLGVKGHILCESVEELNSTLSSHIRVRHNPANLICGYCRDGFDLSHTARIHDRTCYHEACADEHDRTSIPNYELGEIHLPRPPFYHQEMLRSLLEPDLDGRNEFTRILERAIQHDQDRIDLEPNQTNSDICDIIIDHHDFSQRVLEQVPVAMGYRNSIFPRDSEESVCDYCFNSFDPNTPILQRDGMRMHSECAASYINNQMNLTSA